MAMINIADLIEKMKRRPLLNIKKTKTKSWQLEALEAIKKLSDGDKHRGGIFKCYSSDLYKAQIALKDSLELNKPFSLYFFKVYWTLIKRSNQKDPRKFQR